MLLPNVPVLEVEKEAMATVRRDLVQRHHVDFTVWHRPFTAVHRPVVYLLSKLVRRGQFPKVTIRRRHPSQKLFRL
jgi:hypothetical protein